MKTTSTLGALLLAMALTGCGAYSSQRTHTAAVGLSAFSCGLNGGYIFQGSCIPPTVIRLEVR